MFFGSLLHRRSMNDRKQICKWLHSNSQYNAATLLGLDTVSSTALYLNYHHKIVLPFVHDLHYSIEFATDKQRFSPRYVISIILLQVGFKTQYKLTINQESSWETNFRRHDVILEKIIIKTTFCIKNVFDGISHCKETYICCTGSTNHSVFA